ncbi:unnamed protein product [Cuscuta campestris]|uniref:Nucleoporin NDC1 n=1 Tax=Cuscuta campestris TaxID=132261 RepID=A0A484KMA4_9ASTE|nr:unnamed protein product [Cuscuta campestris]
MSLAAGERSLFKNKGGGATTSTAEATIVKHRFLGFLIWQALQSTAFIFLKSILFSPFTINPLKPSFIGLFAFIAFHLSLLLFASAVFVLSTPHPLRAASPLELLLGLVRIVFVPKSSSQPLLSPDFQRRARVSLCFVLFLGVCGLSAVVSITSVCLSTDAFSQFWSRRMIIWNIGFRGLGAGLFYGIHYVLKKRWILQFPIVQRPPFFSFKMGIPSAIRRAVKLTTIGFLLASLLSFGLPSELRGQMTAMKFITEHIIFYMGTFVLFLCWELSHHLHQVLQTKRFVFSHPKGSAAAETNPSEPLLVTLEESMPRSLLQYLAYIDLCMVCESNVDSWRRAAFFEETGETYKRVVDACLQPLEKFTRGLCEVLDSPCGDTSFQFSYQLSMPRSLLQYLAYIDLCMVCESNVDSWRRAAFFEETGETYKRVVDACLQPLEKFTRGLCEVLDSPCGDTSFQFSYQLRPSPELLAGSKLYESFEDNQVLAWCARATSSLTASSRTEDRYGVAQLSGRNAAVVSALLSGLLAAEALMGKKTSIESSHHHQMDPTGIKWATLNSSSGRRDPTPSGVAGRRKGSLLYTKAYSMADILRTSIYCIVVAFHDEMSASLRAGTLEKDWIATPLYGTRELLLQKLRLFLDFQAN